MIDEEQIIKDIVDSVYGYDILSEEKNLKKLKLNDEERQKKCDDVLKQINSLCTRIEKELGKTIDTSTPEMSTAIRITVFKSIKAEILNKNNVLDANGKIDTGKFLDLVMQSKDEIVGKTNVDTTKNQNDYSEESELEEPKTNGNLETKGNIEDESLKNFLDALSDLDVEVTEEDIDVIRKARRAVNEFENKVQEKIDLGMTEDEAVDAVCEAMSYKERVELEWQYALVDVEDSIARRRKEEISQRKEDTDGISVEKTPAIEAPIEPEMDKSVVNPPKTTPLSSKASNIEPGIDGNASKQSIYHFSYAKRIQLLNTENQDSEIINPANLDRIGAEASSLDSIRETRELVMRFANSDKVISYLGGTSNDQIPFVEYVNTVQKHDYGFLDNGDVIQVETNQLTELESVSSRGSIYYKDKNLHQMDVTDVFNPYIKDLEMREIWERAGQPLKAPTYEEIIKKYGEVVEAQGTIFSTSVTPTPSTIEVPDSTVSGTPEHSEPPQPTTSVSDEKSIDTFRPETPKVQTPPIVAEDVVVGTFEPKSIPPTAEPTEKTVKGNNDAADKSEGNIPLSGVKAFLGEVATVRNAAEATEKLHINGERGVSKDGTNNPKGTPTVEDEPKTGEVPEEPQ